MAPPRETPATTSVSVGGFDPHVSASDLAGFLESVAGEVVRCRVKTTWTPPNSVPDFGLALPDAAPPPPPQCCKRRRGATAASRTAPPPPDELVRPHAFVHFARPDAARAAAARSELLVRRPSARNTSRRAARRPRTAPPFRFTDSRVEVGNLRASRDFVAAWRGPPEDSSTELDFVVDPSDGACRLAYSGDTAFAVPGTTAAVAVPCDIKLEFSVADINEAILFRAESSLLLRLAAPLLYYRTAADEVYESVHSEYLIDGSHDDDDDPWVRTTDITGGAIGRCWVYRVRFRTWFLPMMEEALAYMKERVPVVVCDGGLAVRDEPEFGQPTQSLFYSVQDEAEGLGFPVGYLVNALVHKGIVNQHQLSPEFFGLLMREDAEVNVAALTEFYREKFPVFDVCQRLVDFQDRAVQNPRFLRLRNSRSKAGDYNVELRSLVITPTRAYCQPPQLGRSNRVIRHYHHVADRFLRVAFMDEGKQPLKTHALYLPVEQIVKDMMPSTFLQEKTAVYRRVRRILIKGFHLCGRKYSFLAFSSSQLRNRSAWFFAEGGTTTAASIRSWMGHFPSRNVAKHAARMGQCFTSSYATVVMQPNEVNECLEDVMHNGYNFSDGIGKITPELAIKVAERLPVTANGIPSAYQIRYAGFKGVVAVWQGQDDGIQLSLRPSMRKFESTHSVLEVVSWTRFQPGFLNRQIITLLTSLGVPEKIFWEMQEEMVRNLNRSLSERDIAFKIATRCLAEHGTCLGSMLSAGFAPSTEPHLRAMLLAIRSSQLQGLLEKTKIFVSKARWLMGCLDEHGILEQGQCFIRASSPSVNNCFVKHGSQFSWANKTPEVIVGTVVMAKNPCLHPGDIRILEAVDVPELYHLVDCLVFPKKGERPHANEASGSDLDGDVYFVTWDEKLVPPRKKSWDPMDYSPAEEKQLQRKVRQHDIIDFFLKNMTSDNIGRISNAHVVHADRSEDGAMDEKCIQLAELAATAVDSHKTGQNVTMPSFLRPKEYPDFMEKEDDISYKSEKILGRLYRSAKQYYERSLEGVIRNDVPYYDTDLEVPGASGFLSDAWQCKCSYEEQLNVLLSQYSVSTEAELVTGEIWSVTENNRWKKHDTIDRLRHACSELRQQFRGKFESISAGHGAFSEARKNTEYEMKASAWYQVTYHPEWIRRSREMEPNAVTKLSFPWIAVDHLARIKMRCRGRGEAKLGGRWPTAWGLYF